jgi:hypothetical protein
MVGDFNSDGRVNLGDYAILANQWLKPTSLRSVDIAPDFGDSVVDLRDLAKLAERWLEGTTP